MKLEENNVVNFFAFVNDCSDNGLKVEETKCSVLNVLTSASSVLEDSCFTKIITRDVLVEKITQWDNDIEKERLEQQSNYKNDSRSALNTALSDALKDEITDNSEALESVETVNTENESNLSSSDSDEPNDASSESYHTEKFVSHENIAEDELVVDNDSLESCTVTDSTLNDSLESCTVTDSTLRQTDCNTTKTFTCNNGNKYSYDKINYEQKLAFALWDYIKIDKKIDRKIDSEITDSSESKHQHTNLEQHNDTYFVLDDSSVTKFHEMISEEGVLAAVEMNTIDAGNILHTIHSMSKQMTDETKHDVTLFIVHDYPKSAIEASILVNLFPEITDFTLSFESASSIPPNTTTSVESNLSGIHNSNNNSTTIEPVQVDSKIPIDYIEHHYYASINNSNNYDDTKVRETSNNSMLWSSRLLYEHDATNICIPVSNSYGNNMVSPDERVDISKDIHQLSGRLIVDAITTLYTNVIQSCTDKLNYYHFLDSIDIVEIPDFIADIGSTLEPASLPAITAVSTQDKNISPMSRWKELLENIPEELISINVILYTVIDAIDVADDKDAVSQQKYSIVKERDDKSGTRKFPLNQNLFLHHLDSVGIQCATSTRSSSQEVLSGDRRNQLINRVITIEEYMSKLKRVPGLERFGGASIDRLSTVERGAIETEFNTFRSDVISKENYTRYYINEAFETFMNKISLNIQNELNMKTNESWFFQDNRQYEERIPPSICRSVVSDAITTYGARRVYTDYIKLLDLWIVLVHHPTPQGRHRRICEIDNDNLLSLMHRALPRIHRWKQFQRQRNNNNSNNNNNNDDNNTSFIDIDITLILPLLYRTEEKIYPSDHSVITVTAEGAQQQSYTRITIEKNSNWFSLSTNDFNAVLSDDSRINIRFFDIDSQNLKNTSRKMILSYLQTNGLLIEIDSDGSVCQRYPAHSTTSISPSTSTSTTGGEEYECKIFTTGEVMKTFPSGKIQILYPNGSTAYKDDSVNDDNEIKRWVITNVNGLSWDYNPSTRKYTKRGSNTSSNGCNAFNIVTYFDVETQTLVKLRQDITGTVCCLVNPSNDTIITILHQDGTIIHSNQHDNDILHIINTRKRFASVKLKLKSRSSDPLLDNNYKEQVNYNAVEVLVNDGTEIKLIESSKSARDITSRMAIQKIDGTEVSIDLETYIKVFTLSNITALNDDENIATDEILANRGVYSFHWLEGSLELTDGDNNCYYISMRHNNMNINLSGALPELPTVHAVVEDPLQPRLFVMKESNSIATPDNSISNKDVSKDSVITAANTMDTEECYELLRPRDVNTQRQIYVLQRGHEKKRYMTMYCNSSNASATSERNDGYDSNGKEICCLDFNQGDSNINTTQHLEGKPPKNSFLHTSYVSNLNFFQNWNYNHVLSQVHPNIIALLPLLSSKFKLVRINCTSGSGRNTYNGGLSECLQVCSDDSTVAVRNIDHFQTLSNFELKSLLNIRDKYDNWKQQRQLTLDRYSHNIHVTGNKKTQSIDVKQLADRIAECRRRYAQSLKPRRKRRRRGKRHAGTGSRSITSNSQYTYTSSVLSDETLSTPSTDNNNVRDAITPSPALPPDINYNRIHSNDDICTGNLSCEKVVKLLDVTISPLVSSPCTSVLRSVGSHSPLRLVKEETSNYCVEDDDYYSDNLNYTDCHSLTTTIASNETMVAGRVKRDRLTSPRIRKRNSNNVDESIMTISPHKHNFWNYKAKQRGQLLEELTTKTEHKSKLNIVQWKEGETLSTRQRYTLPEIMKDRSVDVVSPKEENDNDLKSSTTGITTSESIQDTSNGIVQVLDTPMRVPTRPSPPTTAPTCYHTIQSIKHSYQRHNKKKLIEISPKVLDLKSVSISKLKSPIRKIVVIRNMSLTEVVRFRIARRSLKNRAISSRKDLYKVSTQVTSSSIAPGMSESIVVEFSTAKLLNSPLYEMPIPIVDCITIITENNTTDLKVTGILET